MTKHTHGAAPDSAEGKVAELMALVDALSLAASLTGVNRGNPVQVLQKWKARAAVESALRAALAAKDVGAAPDAVMRHDYPIFQQFYAKHAQGALSAPSCLCCGRSTQGRDVAISHLELPAIVICKECRDNSLAVGGAKL